MKKFKFNEADRDIFEAIKNSKKKFETRAADQKFLEIKVGDSVEFFCGKDSFVKQIKKIELFKSIPEMLKKYKVEDINPLLKTSEELEKMYYSFNDYKEMIEKSGLIIFELI